MHRPTTNTLCPVMRVQKVNRNQHYIFLQKAMIKVGLLFSGMFLKPRY